MVNAAALANLPASALAGRSRGPVTTAATTIITTTGTTRPVRSVVFV